MQMRWIIVAGLALAIVCSCLLLQSQFSARKAVEQTRAVLRQQGFKTDLTDFDFSTSEEVRIRMAALTNADYRRAVEKAVEYPRRELLYGDEPDLMRAASKDSAVVVWKQERLESYSGEDIWPLLREMMTVNRQEFDAQCEATLSGPIQFHLDASRGNDMLRPPLAALKGATFIFEHRMVLELRDGSFDAAWTNLLADVRLATAYSPEPTEMSHRTRFALATVGFRATWQALQAGCWSEDRLNQLQREWESADFFRDLPEIAAFKRACMVASCLDERKQPIGKPSIRLAELIRMPRNSWRNLVWYWRKVRYQHQGVYEDAKALLLHFHDREIEMRRALESPTWAEMRHLPGVTNRVFFQSKHDLPWLSNVNSRERMLSAVDEHRTLLSRAVEAEARRRLVVTAIALERFRGRHGSYPETLAHLVPEFLEATPGDFMDGRPLRYRRTDDGHFVLYSVGLDCVDNGGEMRRPSQRGVPGADGSDFGVPQDTDLVWPRPASLAELEALRQTAAQAAQDRAAEPQYE